MSNQPFRFWGTWGNLTFERFGIPITSWEESVSYRLAEQPVIGQPNHYQWLGRGAHKIVMKARLAPTVAGKPSDLEKALDIAEQGIAQALVLLPQGQYLGDFYLESYKALRSQLVGSLAFVIDADLTFLRSDQNG